MIKALVLGSAALALSAATASAQVYVSPGYGYGGYGNDYASPVADLAPPPAYGYVAPGYGAPAYAAPATAGTTVVIVAPAPPVYAAPRVYAAPPVTTGYYDAPPIPPAPVYDYAPGYYGYRWR